MEKIKVIHIMDKFSVSGPSIHGAFQLMLYLLPRIDPERYEFLLVGMRKNSEGFQFKSGLGFGIHSLSMGKFNPFALFLILGLIRKEKPAILHLHGYAAWNFGRVAGFLTGTPVVLQEHMAHGHPPAYQVFADKVLSILPYLAVAVSDNVKTFMAIERFVRADRMTVISNGVPIDGLVDLTPADIEAYRKEFGLDAGARVLGAVGRLDVVKGHVNIVRALPAVVREVPEAKVLFIGDGPLAADLKREAEELGVQEHLIFLGYRKDVSRLLAFMEIFVMASLSEGLSIAAAEAMAAGKTILSSDCEGLREMFREGGSAQLFRSGDPADLAEKMIFLLKDRSAANGFSERAETDSRKFDIRNTARAYADLYARILP